MNTKYCKFCGNKVYVDVVICSNCGKQIEELKSKDNNAQIIINNSSTTNMHFCFAFF